MSDAEAPIKHTIVSATDPTKSVVITEPGELLVTGLIDATLRPGSKVMIADGWDHILDINTNGSINAVVSATDLDIRALAYTTDSVTAHLASGSTIAVSAMPHLAFATDTVDVSGSSVSVSAMPALAYATDSVTAHLASGSTIEVTALPANVDIRDLAFATDKVDVSGSSVSVSDLPDLTPANDGVRIYGYDGTSNVQVKVNALGELVTAAASADDVPFSVFQSGTNIAKDATIVLTKAVASGDTVRFSSILVGSAGGVKVEFGVWNTGTSEFTTLQGVFFQQPKMSESIDISKVTLAGAATFAVRVTNLDAATNLYATLQGETL